MWSEGNIKVNDSDIRFWVKNYEEKSQFGIEGGRISKLMLKRNNEIIANYDRGWDVETTDEDTRSAITVLMKGFN